MPTAVGPNKKGEESLVFGFDLKDLRNSYKGRPTTNLFPDGHFPGGNDMSTEGGSNPTNEIVYMKKNPGDSKYVLKQTMGNANTEYQISLTNQLQPSTTYCLSGWYAESPDYSGDSRMFHCRAYSSAGNHISLGAGLYNVVRTKEVGGLIWKYCYATITTPSDYSNNFNWYVGYSSTSYSGARYYTNLMIEEGSTPSQYARGTRTASQGLRDLKNNLSVDLSNVSFDSDVEMDFDGTNDYVTVGTATDFYFGTGDFTVEAVITPTDDGNGWTGVVNKGGSGATGFAMSYYANGNGTMTLYMDIDAPDNTHYASGLLTSGETYHIVMVYDRDTAGYVYNNGVLTHTHTGLSGQNQSINEARPLRLGCYDNTQWFMDGKIHSVKIYNRVITASEVKANYNAIKGRFNI